MDYLSLKELCKELSISTAIGRNWMKLGKLTPEYTEKKTSYFSKKYVSTLRAKLQSGENKALKSRRNKKFVSGTSLYINGNLILLKYYALILKIFLFQS